MTTSGGAKNPKWILDFLRTPSACLGFESGVRDLSGNLTWSVVDSNKD